MDALRYLDFDLQIQREGDMYIAQVLHSPAGEASCTFVLPFTEDRLENLVLKMSPLRGRVRGISSEELTAARELGSRLFECVFSGEVLASLRSSLDETQRQDGVGLRLKLRLQEVPDLADLPWEYLFDAVLDRFIAQSQYTPIVRYVEMPQRIRPLTTALPIRILVMISSPNDPEYPPLDVELEKARLEQSLAPLITAGKVQVDWLEKASLAELQRRLRPTDYHVFHYIGHGGFDERAGEGILVLEDETGRAYRAAAYRLGPLLHDHRSLRLAVLNSCEGARNSRTDPFAGMATSLIRQGIPAVVAMQFEITDAAAITFGGDFYAALAEGFPVDAAVAEARKAILVQANDIEWGTPVLYMRAPDGVLFDLTTSPATSPPHSPFPSTERGRSEAEAEASREGVAPPVEAAPIPIPRTEPALQPSPATSASEVPLSVESEGSNEERSSAEHSERVQTNREGDLGGEVALVLTLAASGRRIKAGGATAAHYSLGIRNPSATDRTVRLAASGSEGCKITLPGTTLVAANSEARVDVLVQPAGKRWFGGSQEHRFAITATGGDGRGPPSMVEGYFQEPGAGWGPLGGLAAVAGGSALAAFLLLSPFGGGNDNGSGGGGDIPPTPPLEVDRIYFTSTRETPYEEIFVMGPDGTEVRRVSTTRQQGPRPIAARLPDIGPDGTQIAFVSGPEGAHELFIMDINGQNARMITTPPGDKLEPAFSPDGTKLLFEIRTQVAGSPDNFEIYVVNVNGSGLQNLTNNRAADIDPDWSPDGRRIVFASDREGNDMELWVMDANGVNPTRLTFSPGFDGEPAWAPDGSAIAFESQRQTPGTRNSSIYLTVPDSQNFTRLTQDAGDEFDPAWSADSFYIAYSCGPSGAPRDICKVDRFGSSEEVLTSSSATDVKPVWWHGRE